MDYQHTPVMLKEVMAILTPRAGQKFIDGTLGGGGYTLALAKRVGETGKILAIDWDELAIANAEKIIKQQGLNNIKLIQGNFGELEQLVPASFKNVDGIVLDLGLSSAQLDDPRRGFSFLRDAPLNMAFASEAKEKTEVIVNRYRAEDLAAILKNYGEERFARSIARQIIAARPIKTIVELLEAISRGLPAASKRNGNIHWATRTFQALRIATNDELANLQAVLPQALKLLKPGGRLAVISFHSLEDRIVKNFFRDEAKDCLCPPQVPICVCGHKRQLKILTVKPLTPRLEEIKDNPRSRSAKLRAAIKLKTKR
jgi:16S rRNA (cytosine1402-N4)-methyltransferase